MITSPTVSSLPRPVDGIATPADAGAQKRILLVDDHPVTRFGMRVTIDSQPDLTVCGEASAPAEAMELVGRVEPHLAIVDIALRTGSGIEFTRSVREAAPAVAVLVVSMYDECPYAERAMRAGARGYLRKQELAGTIIEAVRTILAGDLYLSDGLRTRMLRRVRNTRRRTPEFTIDSLTEREREVLRLIGDGHSTAEIAAELRLSAKTIDSHREHLKRKLALSGGAELVHYAVHWTRSEFCVGRQSTSGLPEHSALTAGPGTETDAPR